MLIGTSDSQATEDWCGMCPPSTLCTTGAIASMTKPGKMPASRQSSGQRKHDAQRKSIGLLRLRRGGAAGAAQKGDTEDPHETRRGQRDGKRQQRADRRNDRASSPHCGSSGLSRIAWKVSHSEAKPLNGGSAEIAAQPTRTAKAVTGMR